MRIKKTYIWQLILTVIFVSLIASCSDEFYDSNIGGRISPDEHYNTVIDAQTSYEGCFVYLQEIAEKLVLVDGLRSDQMTVTENADVDMIDLNLHNLRADNPYIDPSNYYKLIININEVIPNLPQIVEKDRDLDSATLFQFEGALITMRSWAYFMLAKLNGEVGLIGGDVSNLDPSDGVTYVQKRDLIVDLINKLYPYYDEEDIFRYPIDHYVLLGEMYLEIGNYEGALKFLKLACDGKAKRTEWIINADYADEDWETIFINSNQQGEVATAVPYSFVNGQKNMLEEWMLYKYDYMVRPTDSLVKSFTSQVQINDDPGDGFRGMGISIDTSENGEPFIKKYSLDLGIPHSADVILSRAADIHLMLAEAFNRVGNHEVALALLNDGMSNMSQRPAGYTKWGSNIGVRGRAYLKNITVPGTIADPTEYIEDLILAERARELAFEGKRWFDLVRIAERRDDPAYLADKVAAKFDDPATAEAVRTKLMDPANWYLPIPK
jgi:tetratricopeptide (TPR) repeat protein